MKQFINKDSKILCVMPKYSYGEKRREFSTEYQSIYYTLKSKYKNIFYFDSMNNLKSREDLNNDLIKKCLTLKPDCVFFAIAFNEIFIETLIKIKKKTNPLIINWCSDDSWRYDEHSFFYSDFIDYMVTTDRNAFKKYNNIGNKAILTSWGCPDEWINKPKKSTKCKYDVIFIGSSYFGRKKHIRYLKSKKIKIKCFGFGWNNKPIKFSEMSNKINNSKIAINFSKSRKGVLQTKARIFEVTGCGSLCITEQSNDLNKFFNKKEVVTFHNLNNLEKKIKYYLKNENLRDKKVSKSFLRCKKNYTYSKILNNILFKQKFYKKDIFVKNVSFSNNTFDKIFFNIIKFLNYIFLTIFTFLISKKFSYKILRRLLFEIEWRVRGYKTYTRSGWVNNLYDIN